MPRLSNLACAPIPARTLPQPWEDLASFVSRVAGCMGYKNPQWVLRPEEGTSTIRPFNLCMLRGKTDYHFLEHLLQLDEEMLYSLTIHRFASRVQAPELARSTIAEVIQRPLLTRYLFQSFFHPYSATKVCPRCLTEEPVYGRLFWNALPVVVCLRHKLFLLDRCPACRHSIPALRPSLTHCPYCRSGDYRESPVVSLPNDALFHLGQAQILEGLAIEATSPCEAIATGWVSPLLDLLPWQYFQLLDAFRCVLGPLFPDSPLLRVAPEYRPLLRAHPRPHSDLSPLEWAVFIATFHWILHSWPDNFFSFLDAFREARAGKGRKRDQARASGVQRDFGVFYERWLYKRLTDPAFTFLHEAFERYLGRQYTGGEITSRLLPFKRDNKSLQDRPYLTKIQARAILGIGEGVLQALIGQGTLRVLKKPIGSAGRRTMFLIEKTSVESVRREWVGLLTAEVVAQSWLGVTKAVVLMLEQRGVLMPVRGPGEDGYKVRLYKGTDVERFAIEVLKCAVKSSGLAHDCVPLSQAARMMGIPLATLLMDILNSHLTPVAFESDQPLLPCLALTRLEMMRYRDERKRQRREDMGLLTVGEVAAMLGVHDEVLLRWVQQGLLTCDKTRLRGKKSLLLIRRTALETFRQTYLFTEEAAERLGVVRSTVWKYVRKGVLHPIVGRGTGDGSNRLLFLRNEVEGLVADGHLTVPEAATALGLSRSRVYALLRAGELRHEVTSRGMSRSIRLLRADVDAYRISLNFSQGESLMTGEEELCSRNDLPPQNCSGIEKNTEHERKSYRCSE
jgi:excisionase family DNA binding protein